jgi:hypothetical protein
MHSMRVEAEIGWGFIGLDADFAHWRRWAESREERVWSWGVFPQVTGNFPQVKTILFTLI